VGQKKWVKILLSITYMVWYSTNDHFCEIHFLELNGCIDHSTMLSATNDIAVTI